MAKSKHFTSLLCTESNGYDNNQWPPRARFPCLSHSAAVGTRVRLCKRERVEMWDIIKLSNYHNIPVENRPHSQPDHDRYSDLPQRAFQLCGTAKHPELRIENDESIKNLRLTSFIFHICLRTRQIVSGPNHLMCVTTVQNRSK